MQILELNYTSTNTYLIRGRIGLLLFDTGWAGTFRDFCREMGEKGIPVQDISYILISHYHPDHCGIAQEIADCGARIAVMDLQAEYVHAADSVFRREPDKYHHPIDESKVRIVDMHDSRAFLAELGIDGEILWTPGHSEDSISMCLDDGRFFVGDLNPLYELELHRGTRIGESWEMLLARHPKIIYYGHARAARLDDGAGTAQVESGPGAARLDDGPGSTRPESGAGSPWQDDGPKSARPNGGPGFGRLESGLQGGNLHLSPSEDRRGTHEYALVKRIMKYTDKGYSAEKIQKKTGAPLEWIRDAMRMYLTHTNITVDGILDRMEIRGR